MTDNFKKTVNLKERMMENQEVKQTAVRKKYIKKEKAERIDKLFEDESGEMKEQKKIYKPQLSDVSGQSYYKSLSIIFFAIILVYSFLFFRGSSENTITDNQKMEEDWYSVELQNGDVFYGLVGDLSIDPLAIKNVYYNYDQEDKNPEDVSGNLRLVKRGKEAHGPDGSINIFHSNINIIEKLKEDSKVLQAILANEK